MWANKQVIRYVNRLLPTETQRSIILLTGARQTGKTTLVKDKYKQLPYYNLDAREYRDQLKSISTFSWANNVGEAILDEIQKEPSLFEKVKFAFDEGSLKFSILTGSSQLLLLKKVRETLAGRIRLFELFPLMFTELIDLKNKGKGDPKIENLLNAKDIDVLFRDDAPVLFGSDWDLRKNTEEWLLKWGGMPALLHIPGQFEKINWLKDYIYAYLERDLSDLARLSDLSPFKRFQSIASLRAGNLLHFSELARDSSTSTETARRYMQYLNISYQNFLLQPYYKNLTSSLVKTPKLYWFDNGLLRQTSGLGFDLDNGQLFENYIASELMKFIRTSKNDAKLYYYRTRSGMEIDFIIENKHGIMGIEVKNRKKITRSDFTAIRKIRSAVKNKWVGGIVVYKGNKIEQIEEKMWAVPSCRILG